MKTKTLVAQKRTLVIFANRNALTPKLTADNDVSVPPISRGPIPNVVGHECGLGVCVAPLAPSWKVRGGGHVGLSSELELKVLKVRSERVNQGVRKEKEI